ncbi:MAG: family 2 glycosyl transferase [Candidatus Gottesmanbacteria bacterium GW2011_GWA2_43_14]|uniref:Family 2 glycosyl transferase n=1 Tax=Candidatus Gottesmanbacteria bacterium GW2011_GWA2_43_14 TaxID=1618443 RepID=A0A0G1DLY2_9BACT|nr:MAG: family 2 glycosyl transferase [Candidatus Gottesmanbacteria bacterium GW2011_GWA2_43_14]
MKLLVAIPAFNEEKMIAQVIKSIPGKIAGIKKRDILVVDDGSTDRTFEKAQKHGAIVVRHIINRGLGGAIKTAMDFARREGYQILITIDADGQHEPGSIPLFIKKVIDSHKDVVVGSRWLKAGSAPRTRIIVNKLANLLTYFFYGINTSDSQSGYRAFGPKALDRVRLQADGMEVSSEVFREIAKNRLSYAEIPIRVIYTEYSKAKGQRITNAPKIILQLLVRLFK